MSGAWSALKMMVRKTGEGDIQEMRTMKKEIALKLEGLKSGWIASIGNLSGELDTGPRNGSTPISAADSHDVLEPYERTVAQRFKLHSMADGFVIFFPFGSWASWMKFLLRLLCIYLARFLPGGGLMRAMAFVMFIIEVLLSFGQIVRALVLAYNLHLRTFIKL